MVEMYASNHLAKLVNTLPYLEIANHAQELSLPTKRLVLSKPLQLAHSIKESLMVLANDHHALAISTLMSMVIANSVEQANSSHKTDFHAWQSLQHAEMVKSDCKVVHATLAKQDLFQMLRKINVFQLLAQITLEESVVLAEVTHADKANNSSELVHQQEHASHAQARPFLVMTTEDVSTHHALLITWSFPTEDASHAMSTRFQIPIEELVCIQTAQQETESTRMVAANCAHLTQSQVPTEDHVSDHHAQQEAISLNSEDVEHARPDKNLELMD
jgi:hypothetical protein